MKLGIIGHHIAYSLSPFLHTLISEEAGLNPLAYTRFDIPPEDIRKTLEFLKKDGYTGVNVTIPYKKSILAYTDNRDTSVQKCGAANTLRFSESEITAWNTDLTGLIRILASVNLSAFSRSVIFGYGGVAPAVVTALKALKFYTIFIAGRAPEKIREFCTRHSLSAFSEETGLPEATLWINGTPAGAVNHPDIPENFRVNPQPEDLFLDLNYAPLPTHFQQYFRAHGIQTEDGLGLLIEQALDSQAIWRNDPTITSRVNRERIRQAIIQKMDRLS